MKVKGCYSSDDMEEIIKAMDKHLDEEKQVVHFLYRNKDYYWKLPVTKYKLR